MLCAQGKCSKERLFWWALNLVKRLPVGIGGSYKFDDLKDIHQKTLVEISHIKRNTLSLDEEVRKLYK